MRIEPIALPSVALTSMWKLAGHGAPPPVVAGTPHHMDADAERELDSHVLASLAERGLATADSLGSELRETISILATAPLRHTASYSVAGQSTGGILVAAQRDRTVRIWQQDGRARIEPVDAQRPVDPVLACLPRFGPADIAPIRVPRAEYTRDGDGSGDDFNLADPLADSHPNATAGDDERLRTLMNARRHLSCQIRVRTPAMPEPIDPLTVLDLAEHGRVLTYVEQQPHGPAVIRVVPGTPENAVTALATLADTTADPQPPRRARR